MIAAGAYLKALRESQRITQPEAAVFAGVSVKTLGRWEKGENNPGAQALFALVDYLGGLPDDVERLLRDSSAEAADGIAAAQALKVALTPDVEQALTEMTEEQLDKMFYDLKRGARESKLVKKSLQSLWEMAQELLGKS